MLVWTSRLNFCRVRHTVSSMQARIEDALSFLRSSSLPSPDDLGTKFDSDLTSPKPKKEKSHHFTECCCKARSR
ncbi:hypothetical protein PHSY_007060 [Pseudozyma hubeiensis SY62]|uniref:Uncharacterized protein n=1 Tax=Pseudozyma hubeiensis (strain SY62) TaxID=1305764 RepID=R9PDL2_PSEHS|nr:hypothetical protein PHSY_007060 [Pseudozyma hubeiensis SY62]GAC99459.1 hypothetical protein PHSY_007060 [Pseudozyma hubeiensis SY62]